MEGNYVVNLNSIDKVREFADISIRSDAQIMLISEPWKINGKSIMGIFSLDLSKNINLTIKADSATELDAVVAKYKDAGIIVE